MGNNKLKDNWINMNNIYKIGSNNKYEINRSNRLGSSLFSDVYIGKSETDFVAVKRIAINKLSFESKSLLNDEIKTLNFLSKKKHPNIIKCLDIYEDMEYVHIITEYCDGGDLSSLLVKPMKEKYIKYYFKQIIAGVKFLHDQKIMHCDLKPKNILLCNDKKNIKICDFGLARKIHKKVKSDFVCGSPLYMAPELFIDKSDFLYASEVWSLGLILYEMVYGYHPFIICKNMKELKKSISENEINMPTKNSTGVTINNNLIDLLKSMLQKNKNDRITFVNLCNYKWLTNNIEYEMSCDSISELYDEINDSDTLDEQIFEMEINN